MDKDILRIVLLLVGLLVILGIYLWDRLQRKSPKSRHRYPQEEFDDDPGNFFAEPEVDWEEPAPEPVTTTRARPPAEPSAPWQPPDYIQLGVVAAAGVQFDGPLLQQVFTELGLRYGEMGIYHYHEQDSGEVLFSIASMVEPGTFPADSMDEFTAPGLMLFLQPPLLKDPLAALAQLVDCCHELAERLDGEAWDPQRRPLSQAAVLQLQQALTPPPAV